MSHLELTLVLAATRDMGIGLNGTLPWTGLKKEMAYFARVTKRLPPQVRNFGFTGGCSSTHSSPLSKDEKKKKSSVPSNPTGCCTPCAFSGPALSCKRRDHGPEDVG